MENPVRMSNGVFYFSGMNIEQLHSIFLKHREISTDTRTIPNGAIYFALKGDNFDGNKFAQDALDKGASYVVVDDRSLPDNDSFLHVKETLTTLQQLARHHRRTFDIPVIGITGSNGKTTTKELMHAVLSQRFKVLATKGNLNNHIGVPLTLLELDDTHDMAIIEMGASKQGDIEELCTISEPDHGLITNIGKAHMETMGGLEGVFKTKTELYRHIIARSGTLLVHSCDRKLVSASADAAERFFYGALPTDDVQGRVVRQADLIAVQWKRNNDQTSLDKRPVVPTALTGTYNLPNIMAAVATGIVFGLSDEEVAEGISSYEPSNNRSEVRRKGSNTFILDAYNANPTSMMAAIDNLMGFEGQHSVILGEMLEVGPTSEEEHRQVCERLLSLKMKTVCLVGNSFLPFANDYPFQFFENVTELNEWLNKHPFENQTVLIKGSRGNKLEKAAERLLSNEK